MLDRKPPLDPGSAEAFNDRGVALHGQQRYEEALANYAQALRLKPDYGVAHYNQGTALLSLGRWEEALDCYDRAIALDPRHAAAHMNRGLTLQKLSRYEDAVASYDAAIALDSSLAGAHNDRGTALENIGRLDEALASYDVAAGLDPRDAVARCNGGNALLALNRPEEALARYDRAISLAPNHVDAHFNRGSALLMLERHDEALASYDKASLLRPEHADTFYNQGLALVRLGRPDEAVARLDRAVELQPDHADAWTNRGNALRTIRRHDEASASYDRAIDLEPGNARAHFNKAELALSLGDLAQGWPLYEWRWQLDDVRPLARNFSQPTWRRSEPIAGRRLLLHAEQGLGDIIQFCCYAPVLARQGADVMFEVPRNLRRLLAGVAGDGVTLVERGDELPEFDVHCPLMSVPGLVGTTLDTIPAPVPYLTAEPDRVSRWRERLPGEGLRIGIAWQGNPAGTVDRGRSAALAEFAPLARLPGVRLVCLQKQHGLDQLDHLPPGMTVETLGESFDAGPDAFLDAAAVMMTLDLVVSTDTAIVHLAGALGRPVWIALKAVPHWTWMIDREDSPWYPSARLFRQDTDGDWRGVFERMAAELTRARRP